MNTIKTTYHEHDGTEHEISISDKRIISGEDRGNNRIELKNGIWLRDMLDGRYYDTDDDLSEWGEVTTGEYDSDDNFITGNCIGYISI
jgi:hypothetical protein